MPAEGPRPEAPAAAIAALALVIAPREAFPVDTVEPVIAGTLYHEAYLALEGLGAGGSGDLLAEYMAGMGVAPRFSLLVGADVAMGPAGPGPEASFLAGAIGTALDTDRVDIDLALEARSGFGGPAVVPFVEINYDHEPDLSLWGLFLDVGVPASLGGGGAGVDVEVGLGGYLTIRELHQLLLLASAAFHPRSPGPGSAAEIGGIHLGYNVVVHDAVELVLEILLDVPQGRERFSADLVVGTIVSLPARSHM